MGYKDRLILEILIDITSQLNVPTEDSDDIYRKIELLRKEFISQSE